MAFLLGDMARLSGDLALLLVILALLPRDRTFLLGEIILFQAYRDLLLGDMAFLSRRHGPYFQKSGIYRNIFASTVWPVTSAQETTARRKGVVALKFCY
jgi:hypothetical protein